VIIAIHSMEAKEMSKISESKTIFELLTKEYPEAQLTIRDKVPQAFLITRAILTMMEVVKNIQCSTEEIREICEFIIHLIPTSWKDTQYYAEMEAAKIYVVQDTRPIFCEVKASIDFCLKNGIPTFTKTLSFDYFKVFSACIDLLNRKHVIAKVSSKEISSGESVDVQTKEADTLDE